MIKKIIIKKGTTIIDNDEWGRHVARKLNELVEVVNKLEKTVYKNEEMQHMDFVKMLSRISALEPKQEEDYEWLRAREQEPMPERWRHVCSKCGGEINSSGVCDCFKQEPKPEVYGTTDAENLRKADDELTKENKRKQIDDLLKEFNIGVRGTRDRKEFTDKIMEL